MKHYFRSLISSVLLLLITTAAFAQNENGDNKKEPEVTVITINTARQSSYKKNEETGNDCIVLERAVSLSVQKGSSTNDISADKIVYDRKTEMLYAEGNVEILMKNGNSGNSTATATSLIMNTSTLEGIFDDGRIVQDVIAPSHGLEGPEKIEENILELLKQFDLSDVKSIGLAIPGPVDGERNVITQATNIPGCEGYPFAANMERVTGVPVFLDNDANAAGLAEAVLGAGRGYHEVYFLTHSTGIGGALVIDGKVISGHKGYAGEVANVIVDPDAKQYPIYRHLNRGGVESVRPVRRRTLGHPGAGVFHGGCGPRG